MAKTGSIIKVLIDNLAAEGERVIQDAYNKKGYQNRTYNLHDSYGSAVYYNGVLQADSIRYVGPAAATKPRVVKGIMISGRDEVDKFFNNYKPSNKTGIELVVIAAIFYAGILEARKYHVISTAGKSLDAIASRLNGKVSSIKWNTHKRFI